MNVELDAKSYKKKLKTSKFLIETANNKYLCSSKEQSRLIEGDASSEFAEKFTLTLLGGKVMIRSTNNKYVSADYGKEDYLFVDKEVASEWEMFEIVFLEDDFIALKASNGKYITVDSSAKNNLIATAENVSAKEKFKFVEYIEWENILSSFAL